MYIRTYVQIFFFYFISFYFSSFFILFLPFQSILQCFIFSYFSVSSSLATRITLFFLHSNIFVFPSSSLCFILFVCLLPHLPPAPCIAHSISRPPFKYSLLKFSFLFSIGIYGIIRPEIDRKKFSHFQLMTLTSPYNCRRG